MTLIDWLIVGVYLLASFLLGMYFARRGSKSTDEYFVAGRKLPWYLLGTSMVATTFSVDTPLAITALVREGGVAGAWYGWSGATGIITATVFFAGLWRRSGVVTDAELVELRYSGKPARALRVVRAVYLSLIVNSLILGWVILAMAKVTDVVFGIPETFVLPVIVVVAVVYTTASGLWGIVATDALQFTVAMIGAVALAVFSVDAAGGIGGIHRALADRPETFHLIPSGDSAMLPFTTFAVYLSVQWWATRNADGGEYLGQRLFAARSVPDAKLGMLWFALCDHTFKMWPVIMTALASIVLLPNIAHEEAYPRMIVEHLPIGVRGLLAAGLLAGFMATLDTHLNWGASYLVNDLYRRFMRPGLSEAHYLKASRIAMITVAGLGALTSLLLTSVTGAWMLLLAIGSGQGLVVLLRWYWWRVNAWSEIAAMVTSAIVTLIMFSVWPQVPNDPMYGYRLLVIVGVSTVVWILVTLRTSPVPLEVLEEFYRRVQPRGGFWGPIRARVLGDAETSKERKSPIGPDLTAWLLGLVFVYGASLGVGKVLLGEWAIGFVSITASVASGIAMVRLLRTA